MHLEGFEDVLYIITYTVAILVLSIVADRKNRNPISWGVIGGLLFPCSLIYLAFLPHLCPECKGECTGRNCPICTTKTKILVGIVHHPLTSPILDHA